MTSLTGGGMEASSPAEAAAAIEQSVRVFRLFETLRGGDSAIVAKVIRDTAEEPSHAQVEGTSILHLAIQCAEPPVVEQILSAAAANLAANIDINAQDRDGNTPLHLASMLGRVSLVRLLLAQQTADGSILNYQGRSALELTRSSEIFQLLQVDRALFAESKVQAVHEYVLRRDYDGLERLLEDLRIQAVLDINGGELASDPSTIESGGTLLHQAAKNKDLKLIQLLLLNGADPFRRDRKGKLPQDITKDDKTKAILKKSPAAAAAQRGIQEKAIVGSHASDRSAGKESREMKGYLKKWTNYTSGYKLRWFVLEDGVLSYYKNQGQPILRRLLRAYC
jgi:ankyrin repeat protein